jgi:hypothetical protein
VTRALLGVVAASAVLGAASVARARPDDASAVAGVYDIKIDVTENGCSPPPITLEQKSLRIDVKGGSLTVNIDTIPEMAGTPAKSGKVAAKTTKFKATTFQGLDGKYEIAGRVALDSGFLELVLVAEYQVSQTHKAYCTESWTIKGAKRTAPAPAPAK